MNLKLHMNWTIADLRKEEFLLIMKALTGRLRPEEVEPAKELGNALTRQRMSTMRTTMESNERLFQHLEEALRPEETPV
jgi:hypothetical protein